MIAPSVAGLALATLLSACASPPDDIPATYVSDRPFRSQDCAQLDDALEKNAEQAGSLRFDLHNKANVDAAQTGIALIFLPTLLFLEGGDGEDAQEYARLKGERKALAAVVRDKGCDIDLEKTDVTAKACDPARGEKCHPALLQRIHRLK